MVLNRIPQPVLARFVRIRPQTWKNGIALRFELYGCQITGKTDEAFFSFGSPGTRSCENTAVVLPSFTPVIYWFIHWVERWVRAAITPLENISCKRTAKYERIFLSLCIYIIEWWIQLSVHPTMHPVLLFILFLLSPLVFLFSTCMNTPTLMCCHTFALAFIYISTFSVSHSNITHTHTRKETHSVLIE